MSEYSNPLETMHPAGTTLVRKISPQDAFASKRIALLTAMITPEKITAAVEGAMGVVLQTKDGPDPAYRTRMEVVKVALNYTVGMPMQQSYIKTQKIKGDQEVQNAQMAGPAARDASRGKLDEAERCFAPRGGVVAQRPTTTFLSV